MNLTYDARNGNARVVGGARDSLQRALITRHPLYFEVESQREILFNLDIGTISH